MAFGTKHYNIFRNMDLWHCQLKGLSVRLTAWKNKPTLSWIPFSFRNHQPCGLAISSIPSQFSRRPASPAGCQLSVAKKSIVRNVAAGDVYLPNKNGPMSAHLFCQRWSTWQHPGSIHLQHLLRTSVIRHLSLSASKSSISRRLRMNLNIEDILVPCEIIASRKSIHQNSFR